MALNKVVEMGRLTRDPELRATSSGVSVATFSIAVDRDFKNAEGERDTDFFDCIAWRKTAEHICRYFSKGRMAIVEGKLTTETWKDDKDKTHKATKIVVENIYFGDSKRDGETTQGANGFTSGAPSGPQQTQFSQSEFTAVEDDDDLPF